MSYAELRCRSAFSFLVGADQPETMAAQAAALGMPAAALTDRDSLSGAVRFGQACREAGIRPVFGVELTLAEGRLVALAEDDRGWANLSRLVSKGQLAGTKGQPRLALDDLADCRGGLTLLTGGREPPAT